MSVLTPGLFSQLAAIKHRTGVTRTGDFTFGDAVNITCRIEAKEELRRGFDGEEIIASHILYTTTPILRHDIIFLNRSDSGDNTKGLEPLAVWSTPSMTGSETLYKVWLNFFA